MKRRNADCGKLRRPLKRNKITEGIYGSTFLYVKFLMVWMLVLMADFILDFRFEYLWPFWLLLRSVYDSFKYQGLAFSVFFVCIAVTSDVICYLVIPVQWLFFAASTYVWVQYVWHTERGICLPTVSLWLLCVYIEASVRLRQVKPFYYMDLCRPFAAHCIGYPVVTLGFGFKSYISYRLRMRKQKDVEKENTFYMQLLQQALPVDQQTDKPKALPSKSQEEIISNGSLASSTDTTTPPNNTATKKSNTSASAGDGKKKNVDDLAYIEQNVSTKKTPPSQPSSASAQQSSVNDYDEDSVTSSSEHKSSYKSNGVGRAAGNKDKKGTKSNNTPQTFANNKDEVISRLESDVKRLKADLQSSRNCEQELRSQINNYIIGDKSMKSELYQLQQDNESLQSKLHNLVQSRQQDKQAINILERKLTELRKEKITLETQLATERRAKKAEEAAAARAVAMATAARGECSDSCKIRRREQDSEYKQICRELKLRDDQCRQMEREAQALRQYKEAQNETDVLMSALAAMQDKNSHLENSLSSETRVKLDLFSALGDAKRQIEIGQSLLATRDMEISDLKTKIAEVLALIPANFHQSPPSPSVSLASAHFSDAFAAAAAAAAAAASAISPPPGLGEAKELLANSSLNPNASDYTPKAP